VAGERNVLFSKTVPTGCGAHTAFYSLEPELFPGNKVAGNEVDRSPPRNVEVKNERLYNSASHMTSRCEQGHHYLYIYLQDLPHVKVGRINNVRGSDDIFQHFGWYNCRKRLLEACSCR
jgi:hypothetical protein